MIDSDNMAGATRRLRDALRFPLAFAGSGAAFLDWQGQTLKLVREATGLTAGAAVVANTTRTSSLAAPTSKGAAAAADVATTVNPSATILPAATTASSATGSTAATATATAEAISRSTTGAYLKDQLTLRFSNGETAEACMLTPEGAGPFPAVLLLHDHGSNFSIGKDKMIQPLVAGESSDAARTWVDRLYGGRFIGDVLAQRGYVVLCVDALGWGSRAGNGYEAQQALAANLLQLGSSLAAVVANEDVEAARFLASLPQVDKDRVAGVGFSFGGFRAWQVAALCDEITALVCGGWMATLQGIMQPGSNQLRGQSAFYMLHPALAGKLDYPDFAGLAAPKPALFFSGSEDRHFPQASVEEAFETLKNIWTAAGHPEKLVTRFWPAAHIFPADQQDAAFDWLDQAF